MAGIPRPSRPLLLRMGSVGPIVSVGVSMAPRVSRAVPHGRPVCRGTVIVSSESDYSTDRGGRWKGVFDDPEEWRQGRSPGRRGRKVTTYVLSPAQTEAGLDPVGQSGSEPAGSVRGAKMLSAGDSLNGQERQPPASVPSRALTAQALGA